MPGADALFSVLGMLIAIGLVLGLAYWFTRHVAGTGGLAGFRAASGGEHLQVLAQTAIGKDERLLVVLAGEHYLLLGVTPAGITKLAELTAGEADVWRRKDMTPPPMPPSFRDALQSCLRKKK